MKPGPDEGAPGRGLRAPSDRAERDVHSSERAAETDCSRCRGFVVCRWFMHADGMGEALPDDLRAEWRRSRLAYRLRGLDPLRSAVAALFDVDGRRDRAEAMVTEGGDR